MGLVARDDAMMQRWFRIGSSQLQNPLRKNWNQMEILVRHHFLPLARNVMLVGTECFTCRLVDGFPHLSYRPKIAGQRGTSGDSKTSHE